MIEEIAKAVDRRPGSVYEITQSIQMRFNELLAGVRGDIVVKIFGNEIGRCCAPLTTSQRICARCAGAVADKVEQVSGLQVLEINVDKAAIARRG